MNTPPLTESEIEASKLGPVVKDLSHPREDIASTSVAPETPERVEAGHEPLTTEPTTILNDDSRSNINDEPIDIRPDEFISSDRAHSSSDGNAHAQEMDLAEKRVEGSDMKRLSGEAESEHMHSEELSAGPTNDGNATYPNNEATEDLEPLGHDNAEVEDTSTENMEAAQGVTNFHHSTVESLEQDDTSTIGHPGRSSMEQNKRNTQEPTDEKLSSAVAGDQNSLQQVQMTEGESFPETAGVGHAPQTSEDQSTEASAQHQLGAEVGADQVSNDTQMHTPTTEVYQTESDVTRQSKPSELKSKSSLRRSLSRRFGNNRAYGEIVSEGEPENSAFRLVVPPDGSPAEVLVVRFNAWRQILRDISTFLKNAAQAEDNRARDFMKMSSSYLLPFRDSNSFEKSGGVQEMGQILLESHKKQSAQAAENARIIANKLVGRIEQQREDLSQKVKEVKHVSGDFKSNLGKEIQNTRRQVDTLLQYLNVNETGHGEMSANQDPYTARLAVDRQLKLQMKEENYLQQAHLNLQASGKSLERSIISSIREVFAEYSSLVITPSIENLTVLTTELDGAMDAIGDDQEWNALIQRDRNFVDPTTSIRNLDNIEYPGQSASTTLEIRAGPLERKTKYLRSYTSAWYVLTGSLFLHEYRSPDRNHEINPIMSLHLPECKLGEHSEESSTSHKFVLKGKQSGQFHRDHSWVFRAESHVVMLSWYNDIQKLCALGGASPKERDIFVQTHRKESLAPLRENSNESADDLEHDEADEVPYSAPQSITEAAETPISPIRPEGGLFSSEANQLDRTLDATDDTGLSDSSASRPQVNEGTILVDALIATSASNGRTDTEAVLVIDSLREDDPSNELSGTAEASNLKVGDQRNATDSQEDLDAVKAERFDPFGISSQEDSRAPSVGVQTIDLPIASQFANTSKETDAEEADDLNSGLKSWAAADRALNSGELKEPVPGSFPEAPAAVSTA